MNTMKWVVLSLVFTLNLSLAQQYVISTAAGGGPMPSGIPAVSAPVLRPVGVASDNSGNLYIGAQQFVFRIDPSGILTVIAGSLSPANPGDLGDGGPATSTHLGLNLAVATDTAGNVFIIDTAGQRIRKVTPDGIIVTVAGTGIAGYSGDGGPATGARLNNPYHALVDASGNLFIADEANHRIRMVSPDGTISTVAGNGTTGTGGDGGPATHAQLTSPTALALDSAGNLYIADGGSQVVRKVSPDGTITTVAGNGHFGFAGDGGPATRAMLNQLEGLAVDASGNLYIADSFNQRIRVVSPDGTINTIAGNGHKGFSGDGGSAVNAQLWNAAGLTVDTSGNLYIADEYNQRVRQISSDGTITTVAGDGTIGYYGDGGPATSALLGWMYGIAVDAAGNFYFSNGLDRRV